MLGCDAAVWARISVACKSTLYPLPKTRLLFLPLLRSACFHPSAFAPTIRLPKKLTLPLFFSALSLSPHLIVCCFSVCRKIHVSGLMTLHISALCPVPRFDFGGELYAPNFMGRVTVHSAALCLVSRFGAREEQKSNGMCDAATRAIICIFCSASTHPSPVPFSAANHLFSPSCTGCWRGGGSTPNSKVP